MVDLFQLCFLFQCLANVLLLFYYCYFSGFLLGYFIGGLEDIVSRATECNTFSMCLVATCTQQARHIEGDVHILGSF